MELTVLHVLALAVVQGVAEFLPISSSGHVVILAHLMVGGDADKLNVVDVNVALHLGTLVSILVVYASRIRRLLSDDRQLLAPLVIATIPAVLAGLALQWSGAKSMLDNPLLAGICLIVTGVMLLLTPWISRLAHQSETISFRTALLTGIAQAVAILPGISRSGATICTGLATGVSPDRAATFSFLMALPVIAGAGLVEMASHLNDNMSGETVTGTPVTHLLLGSVVACVVGIVSLLWLLRWLERGRFHWFAWWCLPVGIAVIFWQR